MGKRVWRYWESNQLCQDYNLIELDADVDETLQEINPSQGKTWCELFGGIDKAIIRYYSETTTFYHDLMYFSSWDRY